MPPRSATPISGNVATKNFLPEFTMIISGPEGLMESARGRRLHNECSRDAVHAVLLLHHTKRIPQHFRAGNWQKYSHMPRKQKTLDLKRRRHQSPIDLVKSGAMKRSVESQFPDIRVLGSGTTTLVGKLIKIIPHNLRDNPGGVGREEVVAELKAWSQEEVNDSAKEYQQYYLQKLVEKLATHKKLRKRYSANISAVQSALGG